MTKGTGSNHPAAGNARHKARKDGPIISANSKGWRSGQAERFVANATAQGLAQQKTLFKTADTLGQYFRWADRSGAPQQPTLESIAAFKLDLEARAEPISVGTILKRVCSGCKIMWPDADWYLFDRFVRDLWNAVAPRKKSRAKKNPQIHLRLYLPLNEWPLDLQEAWQFATVPHAVSYTERYGSGHKIREPKSGETDEDKPNRDRKRPDQWAKDRKDRIINSVGHLLGFQKRAGSSGVTPETMEMFAEDMFDRGVSPVTMAIRFEDIYTAFVRIFTPEEDLEWLLQDCRLLRRDVKTRRAAKTEF